MTTAASSSQDSLARELRKAAAVPWKLAATLAGMPMSLAGIFDSLNGVAQGGARSQVEGDRGRGKLALVIERQGGGAGLEMGEGAERHLLPGASR